MNGLLMLRTCLVLTTATIAVFAARLVVPSAESSALVAEAIPGLTRSGRNRANPDSIARLIAARNPFRTARAPSLVPFDPRATIPGAPPMPPAPPRPPLVLAGLLLGPPHAALIEGLPGNEGARLMRTGERSGEYLLRSISADHVVIAGRDTTWTLRLRNRYQ